MSSADSVHRQADIRKANLGYRPNTSDDAQKVIMTMPEKFIAADTVYLIRNGKPYMKSSAAIRCLLYMKWYYRMWYPICWLCRYLRGTLRIV